MARKKIKPDSSKKHGGKILTTTSPVSNTRAEAGNRKKDAKKKSMKPSNAKPNIKQVSRPRPRPRERVIRTLPHLEKNKVRSKTDKIIEILYRPCSPSSLAVARILFGLMMVIDIPDERGLFEIDVRFGNPMKCHFPLFSWIKPLSLEYMGMLYFVMWMGAAGICVGCRYQTSCIMFALPYWYLFLLDKTTWNNHSYLYGLLSILFTFCSANHAFSVDTLFDPSIKNKPVPFWNYAILRFQFFLLYFYAGVKKLDTDWIGGHSMTRLGLHWVFDPFRYLLTDDQIDFWVIHIFGFVFDLTVGFFLLVDITRPIAIIFSTAFHLMNSRLFHIGQFPYVCLCMTPIFCSYDWPDRWWNSWKTVFMRADAETAIPEQSKKKESQKTVLRQKFTACMLAFYVILQLFLPFSHFITKGYNNWTNGLYGYSWDMMVHNWDSVLTVIRVVDNESREEFFIDPEAWVVNSRFTQHGDMLIQYAECLKRNLPNIPKIKGNGTPKFRNISVYIDSWCSLNGRFQQRMFDPNQDLLKAKWDPFENVSWLMPLLSDLTPWREKMAELEKQILVDTIDTGVLFVADFPGLHLNNYIVPDMKNVTLTVLQGSVILEKRLVDQEGNIWANTTLNEGETDYISSGEFHKVYTISSIPSCYMYMYVNESLRHLNTGFYGTSTLREYDTLVGSLKFRLDNLIDSVLVLRNCFLRLWQDFPFQLRN